MRGGQSPIRVGLIGVGWGTAVQAPAFRMVPPFELVALCSRRPERVATAGEELGIDDVSTDWRSFVARDDLDLISVCTPVDLHHDQVMAAIAAGKHVLVEKPVGLDAGQTGEMLAAAEAAGVAHAVCFEGRWEPSRLELWRLVAGGFLGRPYFALALSSADFWHPTRGLQSRWMYRKDQGGGYLMGMGSHDLDYLCALFGEPEAVCADVRTTLSERPLPDGGTLDVDADDTAMILLRMANGMIINVVTSAVAYGRNARTLEVSGSEGSLALRGLLMGEEGMSLVAGHVSGEPSYPIEIEGRRPASGIEPPQRRAAGAIVSLALMLEDWLPAFRGEATVAPTLVDGHRVARIIDAARASSDGGGWVGV